MTSLHTAYDVWARHMSTYSSRHEHVLDSRTYAGASAAPSRSPTSGAGSPSRTAPADHAASTTAQVRRSVHCPHAPSRPPWPGTPARRGTRLVARCAESARSPRRRAPHRSHRRSRIGPGPHGSRPPWAVVGTGLRLASPGRRRVGRGRRSRTATCRRRWRQPSPEPRRWVAWTVADKCVGDREPAGRERVEYAAGAGGERRPVRAGRRVTGIVVLTDHRGQDRLQHRVLIGTERLRIRDVCRPHHLRGLDGSSPERSLVRRSSTNTGFTPPPPVRRVVRGRGAVDVAGAPNPYGETGDFESSHSSTRVVNEQVHGDTAPPSAPRPVAWRRRGISRRRAVRRHRRRSPQPRSRQPGRVAVAVPAQVGRRHPPRSRDCTTNGSTTRRTSSCRG